MASEWDNDAAISPSFDDAISPMATIEATVSVAAAMTFDISSISGSSAQVDEAATASGRQRPASSIDSAGR